MVQLAVNLGYIHRLQSKRSQLRSLFIYLRHILESEGEESASADGT
ncbi:MAG: hypothetical protein AB4368_32465 [Xenococcaceae cyanobacterium]